MRVSFTTISQGRIRLRYIPLLATLMFVASFAISVIAAPRTYAAGTATRNGDTITYNGQTFTAPDSSTTLPPSISNAYISKSADGKSVSFLIFNEGLPASAATAKYVTYDFTPPSTYMNPHPDPAEEVTIQNTTSSGNPSCAGSVSRGVGWILCPVSNFLASFMDNIYKILTDFLVVRSEAFAVNKPLYQMWVMVRDVANIVFVIAFIIVIYSQITSMGMSKYGLKKAFPRLLVAAILVNISYWICILAVDISNFLGYSVYDSLMNIYRNFSGYNGYELSWGALTAALLSGTGAAFGSVVIAGGIDAAAYLLIVSLVGVVLAALVALVIMAARQAFITILIILAPLAFVAYVLPNTEKLFDKWKDAFSTMLLLFPIFGLLFAGAQLAGLVIIQNAQGNAITVVFGLTVQVAPIVITPLLVRFSGSVLGKVAGIVNNPKKGLLDRTRNWAQDRAAYAASNTKAGKGKGLTARTVRYFDRQKRIREADMKENENYAQDSATKHRYQRMQNPRFRGRYVNQQLAMRTMADEASYEKSRIDTLYDEAKAGAQHAGVSAAVNARATQTAEAISLEAIRKHQAETTYQSHLNEAMLKNRVLTNGKTMQEYAAGIGNADVVLASTIAKERKDFGENAAAQLELMKHFKLNAGEVEQLTKGESNVEKHIYNADGTIASTHVFKKNDEYARDAAAERLFSVGSHSQKMNLIMSTGAEFDDDGRVIPGTEGKNYDYRATIVDAAIKSGFSKSAPAINDKALDDILNGKFKGEESWDFHSMREVAEARLKIDNFTNANAKSLEKLFAAKDYADTHPEQFRQLSPEAQANFNENFEFMHSQITSLLDNPNTRREPTLESIKVMNRFVGRPEDDRGPGSGPSPRRPVPPTRPGGPRGSRSPRA